MQAGTILIVDDNKSVLTSLELLLEDEFEQVETASNPNSILSVLDSRPVDLVLLDMNFSAGVNTGNEGLFWLRRIQEIAPGLPVIMLTAYGDVELAVKALKSGAADFVLKPWDNDNLLEKIRAALQGRQSGQPLPPPKRPSEPAMIIGHSPVMMKLIKVVTKVAKTDANVLITGENGTGKEMLAREIHRLSLRSRHEMVHVDMGAVSESLFESELFGHERGAFTDARESRAGKFEAAHGSTLFLDEIGNLPLGLQAKLLAALQNREITRLGSNRKIPVDIRLIAATNRNLPEMVAHSLFREDLFYRINLITIHLPALRERKDDIPLLARYFADKQSEMNGLPAVRFSSEALTFLQKQPYPGNIRELKNLVERTILVSGKAVLEASDFESQCLHAPSLQATPSAPSLEGLTLDELEKQTILQALRTHAGNLSHVATALGISRAALYRRLEKYDIPIDK